MRIMKRLRVLIAKFGEGYENALLKLAHSCCEAGFEVVYTELSDPEEIVACALQESVDHIGITTLPGAAVENFARLFEVMEKADLSGVRVTAGGFFSGEQIQEIKGMGVADFYPGSSIYDKIDEWRDQYGDVEDSGRCAQFEPPPASPGAVN
jgi:methylmalonyl-CoA mutase C-terminal domain/subunit